jgi:MFS family permease
MIGRLLFGVMCGLFAGAATIYLSEIAPRSLRGAAVTLHQSFLLFGALSSNIFGVSAMFGTSKLWPYAYGIQLIPAFVLFFFLPFCCESPKFVYLKEDNPIEAEQSKDSLNFLKKNIDCRVQK